MSQTPKIPKNPLRTLPIYADDSKAALVGTALAAIMAQLEGLNAPFVEPSQIAPLLGITPNALRHHCRNCRILRAWTGQYRFFLDDPQHVLALRDLIRLALWSMQRLPKHQKSEVH